MARTLIPVDDAMRALAAARSPHELVDVASKAEAMRRYAQRARLGLEAQNRCAELRLRAERKLGEYLAGSDRNGGGRPRAASLPKPVPPGNTFSLSPPTLDQLGIDRKLSYRAQRLADIPAGDFEEYLATARERRREITTRLLLVHSDRRQATVRNQQRIVGGRVEDLIEFSRAGHRMGC